MTLNSFLKCSIFFRFFPTFVIWFDLVLECNLVTHSLVAQRFFILTYTEMPEVNLKVIGDSEVEVIVGLLINLPEPAGASEDTR
jgi:hypothetical protein